MAANIAATFRVLRDGSVECLHASLDGGAAAAALDAAFAASDPAEVSELQLIRNARPFSARYFERPEPKPEPKPEAEPKPEPEPKPKPARK